MRTRDRSARCVTRYGKSVTNLATDTFEDWLKVTGLKNDDNVLIVSAFPDGTQLQPDGYALEWIPVMEEQVGQVGTVAFIYDSDIWRRRGIVVVKSNRIFREWPYWCVTPV